MKANELIHNAWYMLNGKLHQYDALGNIGWELKCYEPIPLTPEILRKAGFKQNGQFFNIRYLEYTFITNRFSYKGKAIDNPIKYLHQLQNLYFALTGKELNIEL